ncbi:MAG TPA: RluA family pseudouridine synthase, partial [Ktedonobacterales bacterium]
RLDRDTSGVVLFARTEEARRNLVRQFEQRRIVKRYLAIIVGGCLAASSGEIDAPLRRDPLDRRRVIVSPAGKPARTRYQILAVRNGFALALAEPLTGRTHQIRAHLAFLGAPLAGDLTYGGVTEATQATSIERTQLHAWELGFRHPATGASTAIRAPAPADMRTACATLGLDSELLSELSRPPRGESD